MDEHVHRAAKVANREDLADRVEYLPLLTNDH
jgi:hypothetical protein